MVYHFYAKKRLHPAWIKHKHNISLECAEKFNTII